MATPARDARGHFLKGASQQPASAGIIDSGTAGSGAEQNIGSGERFVDPARIDAGASATTGSDAVTGKRGRGRPAGSGKQKQEKEAPLYITGGKLDLDSLNFTLFYAHELLAKATKTPEIALDDLEAKRLAESCSNVMKHYNIKASQKAIDWGNLVMTMCIMYGAKFYAISERQKAEKQAKKDERAASAAPFNIPGA